jgi:acetoin utilization protein AcuB
MLMPTVGRYMTREPYSIGSNDSLVRAKSLMRLHAIRHLPVVDGDKLVGIISDRDVALVDAMLGVDLAHVEVARVMEPPLTVWGEEPIDEVSVMMARLKRDCVIVRSEHGVAGVFTATDALEALADIARRASG